MFNTLVSIAGYRISEELYNGSKTLVYPGYREADLLPIVIKLLKNPYPNFSELLSFRNQYTIAKNLNSPLIVQTYSLEAYQNGYALVMEFGGISLKEWGMGRDAINRMGRDAINRMGRDAINRMGRDAINRVSTGKCRIFGGVFRNSDRTMQYLRCTLPGADYS